MLTENDPGGFETYADFRTIDMPSHIYRTKASLKNIT